MQIGVLEDALQAGLLDIGENDERLTLLRHAATDVAKTLEKDRQRAIGLTIAAIDRTTVSSEVDLGDVVKSITKHWVTHRSRFSDDPLFLYRAVGLASLEVASASSSEIRAIVYLIGKNIEVFAGDPAVASVVQSFLAQIGSLVEKDAQAAFYPTSPSGDISNIEANKYTVDVTKLKIDDIVEAGTSLMGNVQGGYFNAGQVLKPALAQISKALAKMLVTANENVVTSTVDDLARQMNSALRTLPPPQRDLRLDIIWWAKAGYSPSLRVAYRTLAPSLMALTAALDLVSEMPNAIPEAVEFVLRDVVRSALRERDGAVASTTTWAGVLASLSGDSTAQKVARRIPKFTQRNGRVTVLEIVRSVILDDKPPSAVITRFGGIPSEADITLEDVSGWLYSDALATRIAIAKSGKNQVG